MMERPQGDLVDAVAAAGTAPSFLPFVPPPSAAHYAPQRHIISLFIPCGAGASVTYQGKQGCLPLQVVGCSFKVREA